MPRKASKQLAAARAKLPLITQPRSASAGATTPVRRPALEDASPHTAWQEAIGEVLSPSVSKKDRNRRLHAYTPYGAHLERESLEWLERHQTGAVAKMERRQSKVVQVPKTPREAASVAPLERLETGSWGAVRQPPRVAPGERPQVLLLQMEGLLAESFHRSLWTGDASLHARPGVIPGLLALRKTYILCALCAAAPPAASRMLAELRRRGLRFDLAFSLPSSMAARGAAPCLGEAAALQLCNAIDASRADLGRRALLLSALELDTAEIEGRSGGELLCSPTKRRPHVKLLLPGVPTLLVPHPRLQPHEAAVVTSELVRLVDSLHSVSPDDWSAAFDAAQPSHALVKMATPLPSPVRPLPARRSPWDAADDDDDDEAATAAGASGERFLVVCQHRLPKELLAPYEKWQSRAAVGDACTPEAATPLGRPPARSRPSPPSPPSIAEAASSPPPPTPPPPPELAPAAPPLAAPPAAAPPAGVRRRPRDVKPKAKATPLAVQEIARRSALAKTSSVWREAAPPRPSSLRRD